jgi:hypothetical protein
MQMPLLPPSSPLAPARSIADTAERSMPPAGETLN